MRMRAPRMSGALALALALFALLFFLAPQQVPVAVYKLALVLLAGWSGYILDRWAFPYSRPHSYLAREWKGDKFRHGDADAPIVGNYKTAFIAVCLRRALIMAASMLAVGLGL